MHKYIPGTHRGRMRVALNYYCLEIRGSGDQELRRSRGQKVRSQGRFHPGGRGKATGL